MFRSVSRIVPSVTRVALGGSRLKSKSKDLLAPFNRMWRELEGPRPFPQFGDPLSPMSMFYNSPIGEQIRSDLVSPIAIDFYETPGEYHMDAEMPGVKKEDIKVNMDEQHGILTVSVQKESNIPEEDVKKGDVTYLKQERFFGKSTRSMKMPSDAEATKIKCKFENGILKIDIPRIDEKKVTEKVIQIEG